MCRINELQKLVTSDKIGCRLSLHVIPNAKRTEIRGIDPTGVRVKIAASPVKGAANKELITYFAKLFMVPKRQLSIVKGEKDRYKILFIRAVSADEILNKVNERVDT